MWGKNLQSPPYVVAVRSEGVVMFFAYLDTKECEVVIFFIYVNTKECEVVMFFIYLNVFLYT